MKSVSVMRHLLWKDLRLAFSLLVAGVLGVILLFPIGYLVSISGGTDPHTLAYALWGFLPFLFAIGAPPTLVGNENERGTLDWLRTLPVSWHSHLLSKLTIALTGWFAIYSIACVALVLSVGDSQRDEIATATGFFVPMMIFVPLIFLGFLNSFLFRNGLHSAIVTLFVGLVWFYSVAFVIIQTHRWLHHFFDIRIESAWLAIWLFIAFVLILAVSSALLAKRRFAGLSDEALPLRWSRSNRPIQRPISFKPRFAVHLAYSFRPRPATALLWQQIRQTHWILVGCFFAGMFIALTGLSVLLGIVAFEFKPLKMTLVNLICCILGVSCFHGERLSTRAGFFADRGVPAISVWWTRLLTAAAIVGILALTLTFARSVSSAVPSFNRGETIQHQLLEARMSVFLVAGPAIFFLVGVLVGQCGTRAIVSFFAAPLLAILWTFPMQGIFNLYPQHFWTIVPSLLVLLFATYRLTFFVMENKTGTPIVARGIGYGALAWLVVVLITGYSVYQTTPPNRPAIVEQLRRTAHQCSAEVVDDDLRDGLSDSQSIRVAVDSWGATQFYDYQADFSDWTADDFASSTADRIRKMPKNLVILATPDRDSSRRLQKNFSPTAIGPLLGHLLTLQNQSDVVLGSAARNRNLTRLVQGSNAEQRFLAIEIALREATLARQRVILSGDGQSGNGQSVDGLTALLNVSEVTERIGLFGLQQSMQNLDASSDASYRERFEEMAELIPSQELRKQSRRFALLQSWERFDRGSWHSDRSKRASQGFKSFNGIGFGTPRYRLSFERTRAKRLIDQLTWQTFQQIETGLPSVSDCELWELKESWELVFQPWFAGRQITPAESEHMIPAHYPIFVSEHEKLIERIQNAVR